MSDGEIILYNTEDGQAEIQFRAVDGTVWLSQLEMAEESEGVWRACDLETVLVRLDRRWDDQFQFQTR